MINENICSFTPNGIISNKSLSTPPDASALNSTKSSVLISINLSQPITHFLTISNITSSDFASSALLPLYKALILLYSLLFIFLTVNTGINSSSKSLISGENSTLPVTTANPNSFAFTSLIMIQAYWDATYDITDGIYAPRVIVGGVAATIFILNIFTGRLKKGTAKKQIRRTVGMR